MSIWFALVLLVSINLAPTTTTDIAVKITPKQQYLLHKTSEDTWVVKFGQKRQKEFVITTHGTQITITGLVADPMIISLSQMVGDKPDWKLFNGYKYDNDELQVISKNDTQIKLRTKTTFRENVIETNYTVIYQNNPSN